MEYKEEEKCWSCKFVKIGGLRFPAGCCKLVKDNLDEDDLKGCIYFEEEVDDEGEDEVGG